MQDDLRDATRMLRSQPGFAAAALLMLALGIGATAAIFTVVNAVLINPLPYPDSDALVSIVHTGRPGRALLWRRDLQHLPREHARLRGH